MVAAPVLEVQGNKIEMAHTLDPEQERVRNDLLYLAREYLGYKDLTEELHGQIAEELMEMTRRRERGDFIELDEDDTSDSKLILIPRGFLKTSLGIAWVIQMILRDQNITIRIISYAYSKGTEILAEIKQHLQSEALVNLFPDILHNNPKKYAAFWREECVTVKRTKTVAGYTIYVNSIMAGFTGTHCAVILFDDVHDMENTQTEELIRKVIHRIKNSRSVLDPDGMRVFLGTIWMKDDAYNWCQRLGFPTTIIPCVKNKAGEPCELDDKDAVSVFPGKFTIAKLKQIRKEQGKVFFAKQYMLQALADEDIKFKEEWFKFFDADPEYKKVYLLVDPALSRTKKQDDTVMCVVGDTGIPGKPLYCSKSKGMRERTSKIINAIFNEYEYWQHKGVDIFVGIEQAALQYILIEWIQKEQNKRKIFFEVNELKHKNRPKPERISKLQPLIENGGIIFHSARCSTQVKQLMDYGTITRDDHADALAYLPDVIGEVGNVDIIDVNNIYDNTDPNSMEALLEQMELGGQSWLAL